MLVQQLLQCHNALTAGGGQILCLRANYGTGILPSLFGARLFYMEAAQNTLPTAVPLAGGIEAIQALLRRGVPDLESGLGGRTLEMGQRFVNALRDYPRLRRHVYLYHPDLQGPIDVCEVLWGSRLFLDIVDHPQLVKDVLALLTETYIQFMRRWMRIVPPLNGHSVHWSLLHKGRIMLRDDSAMNFSPRMYDEFIGPCDQRLLREFGGGGIHFCGRGDHYIASACRLEGMTAIAMSQPDYNDMETIYRHTIDRGIPLLSFPRRAAEAALAKGRSLRHQVQCWP
jgi:hypothetical protein